MPWTSAEWRRSLGQKCQKISGARSSGKSRGKKLFLYQLWTQGATSVAVLATTQRSAQAKERLEARTAARKERRAARALVKTKEGSMVARLLARALGILVRAQVQDKLAKDVRRWMAAGVGTAAGHTLRRTVHRRARARRGASGPSAGCAIQQALPMEKAICNWTGSTVVAAVETANCSWKKISVGGSSEDRTNSEDPGEPLVPAGSVSKGPAGIGRQGLQTGLCQTGLCETGNSEKGKRKTQSFYPLRNKAVVMSATMDSNLLKARTNIINGDKFCNNSFGCLEDCAESDDEGIEDSDVEMLNFHLDEDRRPPPDVGMFHFHLRLP